mmetsp:Transcript_34647/g.63123  ORF Transcript_34647/g.63123 Transcript_34647/m.63123 type:complete len:488 (+) Transcript_34647:567-2030(+)
MSSPRAATSVAIRIGTFCCRKSSRAASRAPWPLSPWMAPTFQPARRRSPSSREHSFLYRPKTITRLRPSWYRSSSCCSRAPRSRSPITSTHCETRALAASLDPPIVTRTGRSRNSAASSRTSRGHVAENMAVRRPPAAAAVAASTVGAPSRVHEIRLAALLFGPSLGVLGFGSQLLQRAGDALHLPLGDAQVLHHLLGHLQRVVVRQVVLELHLAHLALQRHLQLELHLLLGADGARVRQHDLRGARHLPGPPPLHTGLGSAATAVRGLVGPPLGDDLVGRTGALAAGSWGKEALAGAGMLRDREVANRVPHHMPPLIGLLRIHPCLKVFTAVVGTVNLLAGQTGIGAGPAKAVRTWLGLRLALLGGRLRCVLYRALPAHSSTSPRRGTPGHPGRAGSRGRVPHGSTADISRVRLGTRPLEGSRQRITRFLGAAFRLRSTSGGVSRIFAFTARRQFARGGTMQGRFLFPLLPRWGVTGSVAVLMNLA